MAINGNNILIMVDGAAIAGTKSNEMQVGAEMIEIASPTNGDWSAFISGRKEWSVTSNWLVTAVPDIKRALRIGATVTIRIIGRGQTKGLAGTAIVQKCAQQYVRGNLASGSFSFQGSGPLVEE
jgi:predicted secreted protein